MRESQEKQWCDRGSGWKKRTKVCTPFIVGLISFVILAQNNDQLPEASSVRQVVLEVTTEAEPIMVMLRIVVYDDTEKNKLGDRAEIWVRGNGSWWIAKDVTFGSGMKDLARFEAGKEDRFYIYPDGRERGKEMIVPFLLTEDMCLDGCARNMVNLDISDKSVEVHGRPVENVTFAR